MKHLRLLLSLFLAAFFMTPTFGADDGDADTQVLHITLPVFTEKSHEKGTYSSIRWTKDGQAENPTETIEFSKSDIVESRTGDLFLSVKGQLINVKDMSCVRPGEWWPVSRGEDTSLRVGIINGHVAAINTDTGKIVTNDTSGLLVDDVPTGPLQLDDYPLSVRDAMSSADLITFTLPAFGLGEDKEVQARLIQGEDGTLYALSSDNTVYGVTSLREKTIKQMIENPFVGFKNRLETCDGLRSHEIAGKEVLLFYNFKTAADGSLSNDGSCFMIVPYDERVFGGSRNRIGYVHVGGKWVAYKDSGSGSELHQFRDKELVDKIVGLVDGKPVVIDQLISDDYKLSFKLSEQSHGLVLDAAPEELPEELDDGGDSVWSDDEVGDSSGRLHAYTTNPDGSLKKKKKPVKIGVITDDKVFYGRKGYRYTEHKGQFIQVRLFGDPDGKSFFWRVGDFNRYDDDDVQYASALVDGKIAVVRREWNSDEGDYDGDGFVDTLSSDTKGLVVGKDDVFKGKPTLKDFGEKLTDKLSKQYYHVPIVDKDGNESTVVARITQQAFKDPDGKQEVVKIAITDTGSVYAIVPFETAAKRFKPLDLRQDDLYTFSHINDEDAPPFSTYAATPLAPASKVASSADSSSGNDSSKSATDKAGRTLFENLIGYGATAGGALAIVHAVKNWLAGVRALEKVHNVEEFDPTERAMWNEMRKRSLRKALISALAGVGGVGFGAWYLHHTAPAA